MVAVEDLPDDVLALVFSFVKTEMLLGVLRAVCSRWRGLALHPDAWRDRSVKCIEYYRYDTLFLLTKVLTLAPCLMYLEIDTDVEDSVNGHPWLHLMLSQLASSSPCAVRSLFLISTVRESPHLPLFPCILRRQVSLGRLRRLGLCIHKGGIHVRDMLEAVADLKLEELNFQLSIRDDEVALVPAAPEGRWGDGSLQKLKLAGLFSNPVLHFLVTHRLPTLESVDFINVINDGFSAYAPLIAALAGCSKLKFAAVPAVVEVASLAACPSLDHLIIFSLSMPSLDEEELQEVGKAVRTSFAKATTLRVLEFEGNPFDDVAVDVVSALSQSGASNLQELTLPDSSELQLERLLRALPGLPRLREVHLCHGPPDNFDLGVAASVAPQITWT